MVIRNWWDSNSTKGSFLALKSWKEVCKLKKAGGLGFKHFKDMNSALLAKLGWKIAMGENMLWTKLLRSKYLKGRNFFEY